MLTLYKITLLTKCVNPRGLYTRILLRGNIETRTNVCKTYAPTGAA